MTNTRKGFRVSFTVESMNLSTIIGAIENEVSDLKIEQVELTGAPIYRAPVRIEGGIENLILKTFSKGSIVTMQQIGDLIASKGASATSSSPAVSALKKKGLVELIAPRTFKFL